MSRQAVTSLAPTRLTGAATVPIPASPAQAWQSWGPVIGSPGTTPIPAPRPSAVPQDTTALAQVSLHRSSDAPAVWFPGVYYQPGPASRAPVSVLSDNQMPVPAVDPLGKPAVMMGRPRLGGQFQQAQPKSLPIFLNMGGRSG